MKAKAAKTTPEPEEPKAKGPRARSHDGRFVGGRVNEDEVPRLPIFPAQWAALRQDFLLRHGHVKPC